MAIYLLVNGSRLAPETSDPERLTFRLTLPAREIRLISGHAVPTAIDGHNDRRRLGFAVREIRWRQGQNSIQSSIASASFIDGFHNLEHYNDEEGSFRWTNGDAGLPPAIMPPWHGETSLELRVYRWTGSEQRTSPTPQAALLSAFENIGENCELALAQRHYGAEPPLTLLRWAGTTYQKLMHGLETRFKDLGEPESTTVDWHDIDYRLRTPYLSFHTAVSTKLDEAGVADIHATGCVTLRLLRRKLLKDIADARRIFVFSTADPEFGQAEMHGLHQALRTIGPASLLCVTLAGAGEKEDKVERLGIGLYAGYLEKFVIPDGPFDEWLTLCSRALALHYGG